MAGSSAHGAEAPSHDTASATDGTIIEPAAATNNTPRIKNPTRQLHCAFMVTLSWLNGPTERSLHPLRIRLWKPNPPLDIGRERRNNLRVCIHVERPGSAHKSAPDRRVAIHCARAFE